MKKGILFVLLASLTFAMFASGGCKAETHAGDGEVGGSVKGT